MTEPNSQPTHFSSPEGKVLRPSSAAELQQAIELAFDYRGDVTIERTSGESIPCFVFNRSGEGPSAWLEVFPSNGAGVLTIPYTDVAAITFSGEDTANGKSWESWHAKKESERRAESERVEAEARARGHL
ncbi:MAG: hypothetical protein KF814_10700 [Nitrospiraceae bacterium]|nr:hypothetical protein [Nitrospiraceae bacterium]